MPYSEMAYFDGFHFAHIAEFQARQRLRSIDKRNAALRAHR